MNQIMKGKCYPSLVFFYLNLETNERFNLLTLGQQVLITTSHSGNRAF